MGRLPDARSAAPRTVSPAGSAISGRPGEVGAALMRPASVSTRTRTSGGIVDIPLGTRLAGPAGRQSRGSAAGSMRGVSSKFCSRRRAVSSAVRVSRSQWLPHVRYHPAVVGDGGERYNVRTVAGGQDQASHRRQPRVSRRLLLESHGAFELVDSTVLMEKRNGYVRWRGHPLGRSYSEGRQDTDPCCGLACHAGTSGTAGLSFSFSR